MWCIAVVDGSGSLEICDDYTITVVDVFSMPQMGTTISVESVDPVY